MTVSRLLMGVACLVVALSCVARAAAAATPLRPLGLGPASIGGDTRSMLVGDGRRYLAWTRPDGALERWDTQSGTRLVRAADGLGTKAGCSLADLRHGLILDDCGTPRLIRVRDLSVVATATPTSPTDTYGWERVGSQWVAGGQYTCEHPMPNCPATYLNWHTGQVRMTTGVRTRDLDSPGVPVIKACGRLPEFWCVPDGSSVLRMSFTSGLSLARPGRAPRKVGLSGFRRSFFAGGVVATVGGGYASVLSTRTWRSVRFTLPDVGKGFEWHTIAATRQRVLVSAMANGLVEPINVRYFTARIPSTLWR